MQNYVKVAKIFTEMEVKASEKKEEMRIAGELVSTIDETKETNDKKAITSSYNNPERMIPEIAQNARDSKSKNLAFVNKMDAEEVADAHASIYTIVANDGEQMPEEIMRTIYAQLPGLSTKKNDAEKHGSYGYGSCYKFFQKTLTFANDATNRCCYVALTSPQNLLCKGDPNFMPIVVNKYDGDFREIINMKEGEFGFNPTFATVFKDCEYFNPNYILLNGNVKEHVLTSSACSMDTLDIENIQTYMHVTVDLLNVFGVAHAHLLKKKYSAEKMHFTCFARPYDEEELNTYLRANNIDINYTCLSGTEELAKLNAFLEESNYPVRYRFYRKDENRYTIIFVGFDVKNVSKMYAANSITSIRTKETTDGITQTFISSRQKRSFNGLYRAYKGHPCVNDMPKNRDLFVTSLYGLFSTNNGSSDHVRIIVNDNTLTEDLNRANFCNETIEQKNFLNEEAKNFAFYIKRDFGDLLKKFDVSEHDSIPYIDAMRDTMSKKVANLKISNLDDLETTPDALCRNFYNLFQNNKEPRVRENFKTFFVDNGLCIKECFAIPTCDITEKQANADCLGIDFAGVLSEYPLPELEEIMQNPKEFSKLGVYLQNEYQAIIEFESSLSHFFAHNHTYSYVTHIVASDIDGFEIGVEKEYPNRNFSVMLTKNTKKYAKARYILSIRSSITGDIHKIDVLNLNERRQMV